MNIKQELWYCRDVQPQESQLSDETFESNVYQKRRHGGNNKILDLQSNHIFFLNSNPEKQSRPCEVPSDEINNLVNISFALMFGKNETIRCIACLELLFHARQLGFCQVVM